MRSNYPSDNFDWRVYREVLNVWKMFRENLRFVCEFTYRESNQQWANKLANSGRTIGMSYVGFSFPIFPYVAF